MQGGLFPHPRAPFTPRCGYLGPHTAGTAPPPNARRRRKNRPQRAGAGRKEGWQETPPPRQLRVAGHDHSLPAPPLQRDAPAPARPRSAPRPPEAGPAASVTGWWARPAGRGEESVRSHWLGSAKRLRGWLRQLPLTARRRWRAVVAGGEVSVRVVAARRSLGTGAQHGRGCGAWGTCGLVALAPAGACRPCGNG